MSLIKQVVWCSVFVITVYGRPDAIDHHIYRTDDARPIPHSLNPIGLVDRLFSNTIGRILDGNLPRANDVTHPNLVSSFLNYLGMFARHPGTGYGPRSDKHYIYDDDDYEDSDYLIGDTSLFRAKDPFTNDVKENEPKTEPKDNLESDDNKNVMYQNDAEASDGKKNNTNTRPPRTSRVDPPTSDDSENAARSSVAKPQGQGFLPTYVNTPNQGNFMIPISSLPQNPNYITNGVNLPGLIFNPQNPSVPINNGNTGNLFFPISGSQPNLIYLINPNNVNPGTNTGNPTSIPINFINNQGHKIPGSSGFYYVPPKGSGATPVNLVPTPGAGLNFVPGNGGSTISFVPGNGSPNAGGTFIPGSGSNAGPISFVPGNGTPIRFVPANGLSDANGSPIAFVPGGSSGEGTPVGFVPVSGDNPSFSVINAGGNYLVTNKGSANPTEAAINSNGDKKTND